jgi:aspartate 1-decarboxylase
MQRQMLKSKIHRATITDCDVDYVGSITLDPALMRQADLLVNEQVHVWDIDNGAGFGAFDENDLERYSPVVVHVNDENEVTAVDSDPSVLLGADNPDQEALL